MPDVGEEEANASRETHGSCCPFSASGLRVAATSIAPPLSERGRHAPVARKRESATSIHRRCGARAAPT